MDFNLPKLSRILPESLLADEKIRAVAQALDLELENLAVDTKKVLHLPRLDELEGKILDLLMWQLHVDSAEPLFLDDDTKRELIRDSVFVHRLKGTRAALEKVNAAFGRDIRIEEWFDSGDKPFTFKIYAPPFKDNTAYESWLRQIYDVKNVRSWFEVFVEIIQTQEIYVGIARAEKGKMSVGAESDWYMGIAVNLRGTLTIDAVNSEYFSAIAQLIRGTLTVNIDEANSGYFAAVAQFITGTLTVQSDDSDIPNGESLTLYFNFPSGERRQISIKNPRANLTTEEINAFEKFVIENNILMSTDEDEAAKGLNRVSANQPV